MEDLFEREQAILDRALCRSLEETPCSSEEYAALAKEYQRLLRQLRRITKISDRTAIDLNSSKLDLLDKVQYDELTGIYNRRYLNENSGRVLDLLVQSGGMLSVMMVDIDFFKQYNDTYGHSRGDDCLHRVAQTIKGCIIKPEDFTVRYGGEEFLVVLLDVDKGGACRIGERILEAVRTCKIPHEKSRVADWVTVSVGITTGKAEAYHTMDDYVQAADKALYLSKQNGRDRSTYVSMEEEL